MENAADALKIAFAIFVFVLALSILFSLISKIKSTADDVLFITDKTNFYKFETGSLDGGREVGEENVIAALTNSGKDLTYVYIEDKNGNSIYSPSSSEDINTVISNKLTSGNKYKERVLEIKTGGSYAIGEDNTELELSNGKNKNKIYIFYNEI